MFYEPLDSDPDSCESSRADTVATSDKTDMVATLKTTDMVATMKATDIVATMKTADRVATEQTVDTSAKPGNRDKVSPKEVTVTRYYNFCILFFPIFLEFSFNR